MTRRLRAARRFGAALAVTVGSVAAGAAAQGQPAGSIGFLMQIHLPDSLKRTFPLGDSIELRGTVYSDGRHVAVEATPGLGTAMPMLADLRLVFLLTPGVDTVHGAVLFPPAMTGMTGGPAGYKLDLPLHANDSTGTAARTAATQLDSAAVFAALGSTSTVAGIRCEEWMETSGADTTRLCMIVAPPEVEQFRGLLTAATGAVPGSGTGLRAPIALQAFGGRHMLPVRIDNAAQGVHFEVTSVSADVPDSTHFVLPANLMPFVNPLKPGGR